MRSRLLLLAMLAPTLALADPPDFDRPGAGFATSVLPTGGIALEQGVPTWSREPADGGGSRSLYTADSLVRIGLGGPAELQLGGSFWNRLRQPGDRETGHGDSSVGMKLAPNATGNFSWAVLGQLTLANGHGDIGNGARQYTLGSTLGWKFADEHQLSVYLNLDRLRGGNTWTAAPVYTVPVTEHLSAYVETDLIHDGDDGNQAMAGGGLALIIGDHVQADTFVLHRVGPRGTEWRASLGLSVYFGKPR
jgi:hypothetical protein